jgi:hypothetical protein
MDAVEQPALRLSALAQDLSGDGLAGSGVDVNPATLEPIHGDLVRKRAPRTQSELGVRS